MIRAVDIQPADGKPGEMGEADDRQFKTPLHIREREAARRRAAYKNVREIGPAPAVKNQWRRVAAGKSLRVFLESYFPWAFRLKWSKDHVTVINKIEAAALHGGLFAMAMPRGSGKTTICERAALWVLLTGLHKFVVVLGASEEHAQRMLTNIKSELWLNDLLHEDWPEVTHPIRALENETRRCRGQLWDGQHTSISWGAKKLQLARTPPGVESMASGSVVQAAGITGSIRGLNVVQPDGRVLRPSFVLIDDPQTRESALSESQCAVREATIAGDVLGMAGPDRKIAAVMPCTVIRRGDMADKLLNSKLHPDWNGERTKMVYSFPQNQALWDEYAETRAAALREGRQPTVAVAFYRANRQAMDEGSAVAWPQRKPGSVSAIQYAMDLLFRDRAAFMAEYQNEPIEEKPLGETPLTSEQVMSKLSGTDRGVVPAGYSTVTAFVDVQQHALYWKVCGWADGFSGTVMDYGTWPDQGRPYFVYSDLSKTIDGQFPGQAVEAQLLAALTMLVNDLCLRTWAREDGTAMRIDRLLIDSGWQTDTVYEFCRTSPHAAVILPSKGFGVTAANKPLNEYEKRAGEKAGMFWRLSTAAGRGLRHVLIDTNWWKSFALSRLATLQGAPGSLSLFGRDPNRHRMLADHLTSEFGIPTEGRGRRVIEWKLKTGRDNHWLDGLVGCAVGASIQGCSLIGAGQKAFAPPARVSFSQAQAKARERR